jgi:hypothetical protein
MIAQAIAISRILEKGSAEGVVFSLRRASASFARIVLQ